MLRSAIIQGVKEVRNALKKSNISELINIMLSRTDAREEKSQLNIFQSFREYIILAEKYNPAAKEIIKILDIGILQDTNFWNALFKEGSPKTVRLESVVELYHTLNFVEGNLEKFLLLLEREADHILEKEDKQKKGELDIIKAIILENKQTSTPSRLVMALESIEMLYQASADILKLESNTISIIGCDSGSDKSFDFLGLAKVIDCVKKIILSLWDKVIFYRELKLHSHLELISDSLPIIEKISEMESKKQLEPEQAALLKRKITEGVKKFFKAGVTIPEIQEKTTFNPRELMSPEPKLLTSTTKETVNQNKKNKAVVDKNINKDELENLDKDDIKKLKTLLNKIENKKAD